ncbi:AzlD domain-containing protein [Aerolutibacter ruishenii]|uniref:Branched-subunit amino acid transport protein AzlD n=1 Tax=Aerolutibacter ruishenii TaxID=686800 RepID=A0A562M3L1_9GAMM|nr:AzlD domain-containing protein [Lysobacter ruishenii]TWI14368.1 branched-subunit amino acid transport protein AzlD [Lysobacter ruishenii]
MSLWGWILLASAAAYATKLAGYLVPPQWLQNPRMTRVAGTLTIGLLASLTAMNAFSAGQALVFDARTLALVAAGVALWLRVPFLGVVVVGAAAAALARAMGMG